MDPERQDVDTPRTQVAEHWDRVYSENGVGTIDSSSFPYAPNDPSHSPNAAHQFFAGRVHDAPKTNVLEIGCGEGHLAVHLAKRGAAVTAVDVSPLAVETARMNAAHNGVQGRMHVHEMDALELDSLSQSYDFVVGRFVLHHIEPFPTFVEILDSVTSPSAQGVFLENSARNRLLMLARKHFSGRFGIPKYGDSYEQPLSGEEINTLRTNFEVQPHHPELVFFKKINTYLIGYENGWETLIGSIKSLDDTLYRFFPSLRKYSYLQVLEISK